MPADTCPEHSNPKPCIRCALLCGCGCDGLREGVSEEVWEAALVIEPFLRQHAERSKPKPPAPKPRRPRSGRMFLDHNPQG